jgi:hypothetical protein
MPSRYTSSLRMPTSLGPMGSPQASSCSSSAAAAAARVVPRVAAPPACCCSGRPQTLQPCAAHGGFSVGLRWQCLREQVRRLEDGQLAAASCRRRLDHPNMHGQELGCTEAGMPAPVTAARQAARTLANARRGCGGSGSWPRCRAMGGNCVHMSRHCVSKTIMRGCCQPVVAARVGTRIEEPW